MWTTVPYGWLFCDGSNYDTTKYAKLYSVLGSNKLPDLRECVLVGAGQSDNEYDANDNPTGIQAHDIYTVGQFKDDQLQNITGSTCGFDAYGGGGTWSGAMYYSVGAWQYRGAGQGGGESAICVNLDASRVARTGTTTHSKQIGVNYCIKAL